MNETLSQSLLESPPDIREAFSGIDTPELPKTFDFGGPREKLAAEIINDAAQTGSHHYVIFDNGKNLWSVWRL